MSDTNAATMLWCRCGHAGPLHEWEARARAGYVYIGPCAWSERMPPEGDEPEIHYKLCACRKYRPKVPA